MFYNFNPMFNFRSMEKQIVNNPQFKEFCEKNKGKTPEQICQDYGLDWNTVNNVATMLNIKK